MKVIEVWRVAQGDGASDAIGVSMVIGNLRRPCGTRPDTPPYFAFGFSCVPNPSEIGPGIIPSEKEPESRRGFSSSRKQHRIERSPARTEVEWS